MEEIKENNQCRLERAKDRLDVIVNTKIHTPAENRTPISHYFNQFTEWYTAHPATCTMGNVHSFAGVKADDSLPSTQN
jgi:hypothetical protein